MTWPQDRVRSSTADASAASSVPATPKTKFTLSDLNITFPKGELSLVCGKLGSGKTLLLLGTYYFVIYTITCFNWGTALLGEADLLTGQVLCPKTPPDAIASFAGIVPSSDKWVIDGVCAYVPQVCLGCFLCERWGFILPFQSAWLRNASIKGKTLSQASPRKCRRPVLHREYSVQSSLR